LRLAWSDGTIGCAFAHTHAIERTAVFLRSCPRFSGLSPAHFLEHAPPQSNGVSRTAAPDNAGLPQWLFNIAT
jgi:hypothetical protein